MGKIKKPKLYHEQVLEHGTYAPRTRWASH